MHDSSDVRRRRRNGDTAPRRSRAVGAVLVAVVVVLALLDLFRLVEPRGAVVSRIGSADSGDVIGVSSAALSRPNFGYSVIPGGAWDAQELRRAIESDAVVADHYRDVDPATMRAEKLTSDRLAYVSYRVGDRVYWTSRKVRIRGGETILTNGQTEIRSRCGNCISLEPMLPTSADEPDESQFDALADAGPVLVSWNLGPSGLPLTFNVPPGDLGDTSLLMPLGPGFPFGIPGGPVTEIPGEGPLGGSPVGGPIDSTPTDPSIPPIGSGTPPIGSFPPGNGASPGTSPLTPFVLEGLLSGPDVSANSSPSEVTPVPEPGTFLLLGSGIAGLLARRWRSRSKIQD